MHLNVRESYSGSIFKQCDEAEVSSSICVCVCVCALRASGKATTLASEGLFYGSSYNRSSGNILWSPINIYESKADSSSAGGEGLQQCLRN